MRCLLFYVDGPRGSRSFDWSWIDKWIGMYGLHPVIIDPECHYRDSDRPPYYFPDVAAAVAHPDLSGLSWVWLSEKATAYWDEVELPRDNVVFCLGSDDHGFYGHEPEGALVQLRPPNPDHASGVDSPWYASMVVPLLLFTVYGVTT